MTDQPAPVPPSPGSSAGGPGPGYPAATPARQLETYFAANRGRFTDDALTSAARAAGYADEDIASGLDAARARQVVSPVQARARTLTIRAYLAVFLLLVVAMAINSGSAAGVGSAVLLFTMLIGFGLSRLAIRRASADATLAVVLALPVLFLIVIAGACVATRLPLGPVAL
jgi:hypothetical protein